jgi:hypothetical protein
MVIGRSCKSENTIADLAPTAGQMPRGLGVALASKCFRGKRIKTI